MKGSKRNFRCYLAALAMALLLTGMLAPPAAWSIDCFYSGYVAYYEADPTGNNFSFRTNPLTAHYFTAFIDDGTFDSIDELQKANFIRSAGQQQTRIRMRFDFTGASCPDPDLNSPGETTVGTLLEAYSQ